MKFLTTQLSQLTKNEINQDLFFVNFANANKKNYGEVNFDSPQISQSETEGAKPILITFFIRALFTHLNELKIIMKFTTPTPVKQCLIKLILIPCQTNYTFELRST